MDFDVISRYIHCIHTQHVYARSLRSLATCLHVDMSCRHMSTCIRLRVDMYTRIRLHVYIIRVVMSSIHYTCRRVVVALSLRSFATCIRVDVYIDRHVYMSTRIRLRVYVVRVVVSTRLHSTGLHVQTDTRQRRQETPSGHPRPSDDTSRDSDHESVEESRTESTPF